LLALFAEVEMKKKTTLLPTLLLLVVLFLPACSGLLPLEEEPVAGDFGPDFSGREQQTRTFDLLWKNIEETYIYYETAQVDWQDLHDQYTNQINAGLSNEEFTNLLDELEEKLPEGSFAYQSRPERIETDLAVSAAPAAIEGIGATLMFKDNGDPHMVILAVTEGSPADSAGLKAHDSIFGIDGVPITLEEGLDAVSRIRGPAGSKVTLDVRTPGKPERKVEVTRARLTGIPRLQSHTISGTNVGYLLFPPADYQNLEQEIITSLQTLAANRDLEGIVLDLRIAGSSQNWPIDTLLKMFRNGIIGDFYNRNQQNTIEIDGQDVMGSQTIPLVVFVGENTRGLSEIFAAGLQMDGRAVIVGERTPGEVESQTAFYLPDGSRMFVESTSFQLANGEELGAGLAPDVEVQAGWDEILPNEDPALSEAVEILESAK
jgi:carboxyl-terminal processing protease